LHNASRLKSSQIANCSGSHSACRKTKAGGFDRQMA
jgi:hypothetical protein